MRRKKILTAFLPVILTFLLMTACGNTNSSRELSPEELKVCGDWAYIHDTETPALVLKEDGTAQYDGTNYTFTCDQQYITLTDNKGKSTEFRYELYDTGMLFYKSTHYVFDGEANPESLVGNWSCPEEKFSFAFTDEGSFLEDGYFEGVYTVDKEKSTFKLVYVDQFTDTVCYYKIDGKNLTVDYPWPMVKASEPSTDGSVAQ